MKNKEVAEYKERLIDTVDYFYEDRYTLLYNEYIILGDQIREIEALLARALQYDDPRDAYADRIHDSIVTYLRAQPNEYYEELMDEHEDPGDVYDVIDIMYDIYSEIDHDIPHDIDNYDRQKFLEDFRWDYADDKLWEIIVNEYGLRCPNDSYGLWDEDIEKIEQKLLALSIDDRKYIEKATEEYYEDMDPDEFRPNEGHGKLDEEDQYWANYTIGDRRWVDYIAEAMHSIDLDGYIYD